MSQDLFVGICWKARKESTRECAERLIDSLKGLARCSDLFGNWFEKGRTRRQALERPIGLTDSGHILRLLENGRHRRDTDKSVMEDMGFSLHIWNGGSDECAASLDVHCGYFADSVYLSNSIKLNLPNELGDLETKEQMVGVLGALVRAWQPDWGGVISTKGKLERGPLPRDRRPLNPFVDWILYLNRTNINPSKLPASATVHRIDDLGTIIVTQNKPIDLHSATDLENVRMVAAAIGLEA